MIQDNRSRQPMLHGQADDLEFEPTQIAHIAEPLEMMGESDADAVQVRDEDLLLGDQDPPIPGSQAAMYESHPAPQGTAPLYKSSLPVGSEQRRITPPPFVPPPLTRKQGESRVSSPPPLPTFTHQQAEPAISDDRRFDPSTSVNRVVGSSRSAGSVSRSLRTYSNQPDAAYRAVSSAASAVQQSLRASEHRPGQSDRVLLERRKLQRKEIIREGDVLLGKLRIERVTSEGLLVTADAVHLGLGTRAQVVLLSPHGRGFPEAEEHFLRTARTVAQMQSEHVARVTEVGTLESGAPFLVAELPGPSDLNEVLRVRGPLAVSDAVDYTVQIAEALAEAHSLGVIHGNLRPASLRLSEGIDGWPLIKVLGFGAMAQWSLGSVSTRAPGHRGFAAAHSALPYLSPEQIRSPSNLDTRTDIWSLGAMMHEMLVGWPLYHADSTAALLAMIAADAPPPITSVRGDVPRQLESIVLRCLEKDRRARFDTVAELARALQPYVPAESQPMVDRIVRVMARSSTMPSSAYSRPLSAMVHVRSHASPGSAGPGRTFESRLAPPQAPKKGRLGITIGAVMFLGAVAGIASAFLATQTVRTLRSADKNPAAAETPKPASMAAAPTNNSVVADAPVQAVGSAAPAAAAKPIVVPATKPPVAADLRRATTPVVRRTPSVAALTTPATSSTDKEARMEKVQSAPAAKAADLFDDIK